MIQFPKVDIENNPPSPILTRKRVVKMYGITFPLLHKWTRECGLPYYKVNGRVFFRTDEFNEWFDKYKMEK